VDNGILQGILQIAYLVIAFALSKGYFNLFKYVYFDNVLIAKSWISFFIITALFGYVLYPQNALYYVLSNMFIGGIILTVYLFKKFFLKANENRVHVDIREIVGFVFSLVAFILSLSFILLYIAIIFPTGINIIMSLGTWYYIVSYIISTSILIYLMACLIWRVPKNISIVLKNGRSYKGTLIRETKNEIIIENNDEITEFQKNSVSHFVLSKKEVSGDDGMGRV